MYAKGHEFLHSIYMWKDTSLVPRYEFYITNFFIIIFFILI